MHLSTAAESWEKVYKAFEEINFTAYDYDAVKQSLIDYLKFYYPENFNDYIETSQTMALISTFAYVAELMAYRTDLIGHENAITDAQRKQSILRMAKMISYSATRNIPLRGLVKITSISISEDIRDSQGNSLANRVIRWNDANNPLWHEQFFIVLNRVLTQQFGHPLKSFQVDNTIFQQYQLKNILESDNNRSSFRNGVLKLKAPVNGQDLSFELVPADVDESGAFERAPNPNDFFSILYLDDGYGYSSDTTGFMMYTKQGTLQKLVHVFDTKLLDRVLEIGLNNINDVDVWVQKVDSRGEILEHWENVPSVVGRNLAFNNVATRTKYSVETLENDQIRLIFGDGDFADIPTGVFHIWVRQSESGSATVAKNEIANENATFLYTSKLGRQESCTLTYSLTAPLQNSAPSEDIEHIRKVAPGVYFTQNRMVNGEDYNSFPLSDPSILRLKSINRTYAGESKGILVNDASGKYRNVKIFGNDLRMYYEISAETTVSQISPRSLIDEVIEPILSEPGIYNLITYAFSISASPFNLALVRPRTRFVEDSGLVLSDGFQVMEKTEIQGLLDRHWYGEPDSTVLLDSNLSESSSNSKTAYGVVNGDTDKRIYDANLKMVTKNTLTGVYTLVSNPGSVSGLQITGSQKRFGIAFDPIRTFGSTLKIVPEDTTTITVDAFTSARIDQSAGKEETWTIEILDADGNFAVYGSVTGDTGNGQIGENYDNGILSFLIDFPTADVDREIQIGDAFIIVVVTVGSTLTPTLHKRNLQGRFKMIDDSALSSTPETEAYSLDSLPASWVMLVERTDDSNGNLLYWTITKRNFKLIAESPTTKFFFERSEPVIDPETKTRVFDTVRLLKSNLDAARAAPLGEDHLYSVISDVNYTNGDTNINAISVTPADPTQLTFSGDGAIQNPEFLKLFSSSDYVYFTKDDAGKLTPVKRTLFIETLTYTDDVSGKYVRRRGRDGLYFMWQHFARHDHLLDPTSTNIIDMYILTRGYYSRVRNFVKGIEAVEPLPPSSLELRSTYRDTILSKMMSDTVIMHSGKIKYLFGDAARPELRGRFRIVISPAAKMTGNQIRARALDVIEDYFSIEKWNFGQSFYATDLCSQIHKDLGNEISSAVLVPSYPTNYFGDLFYLRSAADEIFVSAASLENIEIIEGIDKSTLKQKA